MNAVHHPTGDHHRDATAAATRVALYTRGYEPSTLDRQEAALRHYLATHRPTWRVVAVYRDTAPAGGWRDIRPGLRSALAAAGAGTYDVLLVQQPDRLSRRIEHLAPIIAAFEAASVTVCCTGLSDSPLETLRLLLWAASFADDDGLSSRRCHPTSPPPPATTATRPHRSRCRTHRPVSPAPPTPPPDRRLP